VTGGVSHRSTAAPRFPSPSTPLRYTAGLRMEKHVNIKYIALLSLTMGCFQDQMEAGRDRDGDGFDNPELGGDDCDDDNALINPSAPEIC
jgi:hypothetical protein